MNELEENLAPQSVSPPLPRLDWTDHVLLLVDRSGSMAGIRQSTLQGLNGLIRDQAAQPKTEVRVKCFATDGGGRLKIETIFDTRLRSESMAIQRSAYEPYGDTPLYAAVMTAIVELEKDVRPQDHALVVIQTDGQENASPSEYTLETVRARIAAKQRDGWVFAYLGAELNSWRTGEDLGVGMLNSFSYAPTALGVRAAFQRTSEALDRWRKDRKLGGRQFFPLQLPPPTQEAPR